EGIVRSKGRDRRPHEAGRNDGLDLGSGELRARTRSPGSSSGSHEKEPDDYNGKAAPHGARIGGPAPNHKLPKR
ncbi:hypothetical protein, partial [Rhizobium leguminosarum]|uniref:hypothetical protein n=1 Tax=Rhizobium leguminosarum TaxID=384 RepID=UPI003F978F5E